MIDEIAHYADIHVGFKQRQPHLTQRVLHVAFGDAALASELLENAFESIAQSVEHDWELTMISKTAGAAASNLNALLSELYDEAKPGYQICQRDKILPQMLSADLSNSSLHRHAVEGTVLYCLAQMMRLNGDAAVEVCDTTCYF